jgi:squalene-hopene/tetraprenyl-beta-curcumene cyclase
MRLRSIVISLVVCTPALSIAQTQAGDPAWDARAAAAYLDSRQAWWSAWPTAARDHQTACVSCHTALPYALARPALRSALRETELPSAERKLVEDVVTRVRLWRDVEPFYPDQTNGLPKSSESRGTEAVLNALVLATRDAASGQASPEARTAFDNLWALQFRRGPLAGSWAWLNFHLEPWESESGAFFGASLAAVAVGTEPGYASAADIRERTGALRTFLRKQAPTQSLFNRTVLLWAGASLPDLLSSEERRAVVDSVAAKQNADGGWALASLGEWKRSDRTALDSTSDAYATGLVTFALERAGVAPGDMAVARGLRWLSHNQDPTTGKWTASSLNRQRDPKTDAANFMSDAATGFAILALTYPHN